MAVKKHVQSVKIERYSVTENIVVGSNTGAIPVVISSLIQPERRAG